MSFPPPSFSTPDLVFFLLTAPCNGCCWGGEKSLKFAIFCCCCKSSKYVFIFKTAKISGILNNYDLEKLKKFYCLNAFDDGSVVWQHRIIFVRKKYFFVQLFSDFLYLFLAFSFLFLSSFYFLRFFLATTSHPPSAVSLKCMQFECSQPTIGIP